MEIKHPSYSLDLVVTPPFIQKVGKIGLIVLLVWTVCLMFVPWQQTSTGFGRVIAYSPTERQQRIDAPIDGRVERWLVHEGSHVEEGDSIVEIRDNDPELLNRLRLEREAVLARLRAARLSIKTAKIHTDRQKALSEEGLSSRRAYELAQLDQAKYLTDEANTNAELARVDTRLARQSTQSVKAPRSGTVLRRLAGEHSVLVKAGESLAVLVPDTDSRAVELWISGNDVSLMSQGQTVRLQFEGWPGIQFSGWPSVAVGTFSGKVAFVDASDGGDGKFRIVVVPDPGDPWPSAQYLRQGVRAQGWILLGQVALGYELWRRMNGFPPSVPAPKELLDKNRMK